MKALVYDTETTDLIHNIGRPIDKLPYIIEYFGVTVDHDIMETTGSLSFLIKPPFTITAETTRITGIKPEDLHDKAVFARHADVIRKHIESHDRIVAHNAGYDVDMINIEMKRAGIEVKWPEVICTIEATEYFKGYRLNLGALHTELFGFDFADHHRAEPDTRATAKCYIELVKRGVL
jgi:DNA polymerase III subunit epsilon